MISKEPLRRNKYSIGKCLVALVLVISSSIGAFPRPAHALFGIEDVVFDPTNFIQTTITAIESVFTSGATGVSAANSISENLRTYVLNPLAWAVAKAAVNAITQSIVTWINSGFEGSPAFATDLKTNLRQVGDAVATGFISELTNMVVVNSPYLEGVIGTVARGYLLYSSREAIVERLRYTLGNYAQNEVAFRQGQFNQGGFNAWFAVTRDCGNDPFCVEMSAREELLSRIDNQTQARLTELGWGRGFMSWRDCPDAEQEDGQDTTMGVTELTDEDRTANCTVSTPGSVIESQLEHSLGSGIRQLELADSFNEIIGALAGQLVSQIFGATGLLGASQPSGGGSGGRSVLQNAANGGNASTTASMLNGFEQQVRQELTRTTAGKSAWEDLLPKIQQAVQRCTGSTTSKAASANAALAQSSQVATIAPIAITKLTEILADIATLRSQTNPNYSVAAQTLTAKYNEVLSQGRVDTPDRLTVSQIESIVANGCI